MTGTTYDWRLHEVQELQERERAYLRSAQRSERDAADAQFFGELVEADVLLSRARDARFAASMCAAEARYLVGGSSDSSTSGTSNT